MRLCLKKRSFLIVLVLLFTLLTPNFTFAAADPNVILVNPAGAATSYADSLLISVKITKPSTIKVNAYQVVKPNSDGTVSSVPIETYEKNLKAEGKEQVTFKQVSVMEEASFTCSNNLSFYTKKLEKIQPGVYLVKVDTVDGDGKVIYSVTNYVGIKQKASAVSESAIFDSQQSGTMIFLKGLLKSIFGN